ncbi:MAG: UDP-N-acetylmuramoyl-L-alanyl-D-glutamate--2,6-diaminopimelate ligase [Candidatus Loosdrechtia sp.]|uniref:Mur ligase family protein n=1 Tax=Candidatus Loosdrechtia sp. TaxID=3101272 RepID=UPI003A629859|nr:MAG: UDP-N-acetylmuramoyl-L-alanyl-D-glutamate--2,6-diaminopimelate ligase [Candidatus Jettenia sp. AMX2]
MKLSELCLCLGKHKGYDFVEKEVSGITYDSRKIKKGNVFVAIKGNKLDGHDFIGNAVEKGASVLVVEKRIESTSLRIPQILVSDTRQALANMSDHFFGKPSARMTVIGITGTNGKTTTSYFMKSIINASSEEAGLIGTIHYKIGGRIIPALETTPESAEIQNYLSQMLNAGIRYAVIEASSHALSQHRLSGVRFSSAIFTNLSADHLDYHRNMKNYLAEKLKLVKGLSPGAVTILNADHTISKRFAEYTSSRTIYWYGIKRKNADVVAESVQVTGTSTSFLLNSSWGKAFIKLKLAGKHNVYNALAAAASALALGFTMDIVKKGVESLSAVPGRLENIACGQDFRVFVDFAHTHKALQVILSSLREMTTGRILLVFGCGGDRDRKKRPKMGYVAEKYSDLFWVTSDNPRSEDPYRIIQDIQKGLSQSARFHIQPDRRLAIKEVLMEAKSGDSVIIAGKGHEQYQISKDTIIPFDDREVVREMLSAYTLHTLCV